MHAMNKRKSRECVHLQYRGKPIDIPVASSCNLHELAGYISAATGAAHSTLKLLSGGRTCLPWKAPQQLVRDAGDNSASIGYAKRGRYSSYKVHHILAYMQGRDSPFVRARQNMIRISR